ncbi:MAG: 7,8-didemethyl-8-hydroxy-5-deazariboflavin synthase CofG [Dehalococcoidia bacterium]|nr:7,8-didemethyl-8-hydroxy-5-deazariboflavin synthase CofG [Dehalococcoidia bacterium]
MGLHSGNALLFPQVEDPIGAACEDLKPVLDAALGGLGLTTEQALKLASSALGDLPALCSTASQLRDLGKGRTVTFSPKVFIPLTRMCRDFCGYCTFRQAPDETDQLYMSPEQVLDVARAGQRMGCTEALLTLGERPEQRYPEASQWLSRSGYATTHDYLKRISELILEETSLLPHSNPGTMSRREMEQLRESNPSIGMMLESTSPRLHQMGEPHEFAPSKRPSVRIKTLENAGKLRIPFTTGILIGIGETRTERINSLLAIREMHRRYGHVQEVIVQNFRAKENTAMEDHLDPSTEDLLWTVATSRLILGPGANVQVPPNLSYDNYQICLQAGINDWGGISPVTIDYVNPEAPWPPIIDLQRRTAELGFELRPRLAVYPEFAHTSFGYLSPKVSKKVASMADDEGYVKGGIDGYVNPA